MIEKKHINVEDIDLKELFKVIWESRKFIIIFTLVVSLGSIVYVLLKNPIPIYKGTLLIQVGKILKSENYDMLIDKPRDLKYVLELGSEASISIPRGSSTLIKFSAKGKTNEEITNKINTLYEKLIQKQNEKLKFYKNYIPTKKIGNIIINNNQINKPKKKVIVIVTFLAALIFSIFFVFFIQVIKRFRE